MLAALYLHNNKKFLSTPNLPEAPAFWPFQEKNTLARCHSVLFGKNEEMPVQNENYKQRKTFYENNHSGKKASGCGPRF